MSHHFEEKTPFSEDFESSSISSLTLNNIRKVFPGIPEEQVERAKRYKEDRKKFIKTLSPGLSEEEFILKVAAFSHQWWKVDE